MIQIFFGRLIRKFIRRFILPDIQFSYSQFGEDMIIAYFFFLKQIPKPTYLDIGANEPRLISNTYYFYERGSRGVLVEPNPSLVRKLKRHRPEDVVVNSGVGFNELKEADFYVFPDYANGLSTFSKEEAMHWQQVGMKGTGKIPFEKVIKLPLISINSLMEKYFANKAPNILSIDVEGLDLDILKTLDFSKYSPDMVCVETLQYDESQNGYKNTAILDFMRGNGYEVFADTRVNTIFYRNARV